jgi:uncharacterized protein (DUF2147 family)
MNVRTALLALSLLCLVAPAARAADKLDPIGVWIANEGKAHVKIDMCGEHICGTVVWVAEPIDPDTGKPKLDKRNSDEKLRSRPVIGMKMLDMKSGKDNIWHGDIYNGADGNTYDATLEEGDDGKIDVAGCVFFGLLCKTQNWERFVE